MNTRLAAALLAASGAAAALLMPTAAHAANIGTFGSCFGGSKNPAIVAAGHTPVVVATLDAASLSGLGGLIVENCNGSALGSVLNANVTTAVSNGMLLVVNDWNPNGSTSAALPGAPAVTWQFAPGSQIDLVAGMPYISGAGGTLTNTSMDGGSSSNHGMTTSPMPPGIVALLTTANAAETVGIAYLHGTGRVVYNAKPMDAYLPGGGLTSLPNAAGVQTYLTNILSNTGLVTVTCASSGYTGTQLTWCRNICEMGHTGATLEMWIRRWLGRWRTLPYCAAAPPPPPPPPPGDA